MTLEQASSDLFLRTGWVESYALAAQGRAVISWSTSSGPRLYLDLDGASPRPANRLRSIDQALPVANGSRYAFWARMTDEANAMALFVSELDAETTTRLPVTGALLPQKIAWSGPGHVITAQRGLEMTSLVSIPVDGASPPDELYRLPHDLGWLDPQPDVCADGRIALIVRTAVSQDLLVLNPETRGVSTLVTGNRSAAVMSARWSPDGGQLVLLVRRRRTTETRLIDLAAGTLEVLPVPAPTELPSFNREGTKIAFSSSNWPWNRVHVFDLADRQLSTAPIPAGTSAEGHQWHGDDCYFRVFGPDLPPSLFRWRIGTAESVPATRPPMLPQRTTPVVHRLPTPEGFDLPAIVHEPDCPVRGTVLMLHGGPAGCWRVAWNPVLLTLTAAGYRVVLIETRGTTFSAWPVPPMPVAAHGVQEVVDVRYCIEELVRRGQAEPGKIALGGHSHGAYVAYRASLECLGVAGVIMTSGYLHPASLVGTADTEVQRFAAAAYADYTETGGEPGSLPARCPVLAVHGEFDQQVPSSAAARMFSRLAGEENKWLLLPGEDHSFRRRSNGAIYAETALAFLDRVMGDG